MLYPWSKVRRHPFVTAQKPFSAPTARNRFCQMSLDHRSKGRRFIWNAASEWCAEASATNKGDVPATASSITAKMA